MRNQASYIRIAIVLILGFVYMEFTIKTSSRWAITEYPVTWLILGTLVLIAVALEVVLASITSVLFRSLSPEAQQRYLLQQSQRKQQRFARLKKIWKGMNDSKPVEEEEEIILDHNYDGIRELDNNLPPWWIYSFYATIVFAFVYLVRHHIFNAPDQKEEYLTEVVQAQKAVDQYKMTAKDLIDAKTVELLTEDEDLKAGAAIFSGNCVACHKEDAGGGIGPNLTDQYWILGGGIKNVFSTISEGGRPGKGMVSWKSDLKPGEIAQVASYVISLQGSTPADPKEPQGELWIDEAADISHQGN